MGPFGIAMKNLQDYSSIAQGEGSQEHVEDTIDDSIPPKTLQTIETIKSKYPMLDITYINYTEPSQKINLRCDAQRHEKAINMVIDNAIKFSLSHYLQQEETQKKPTVMIQSKIQENKLIITVSDNEPGFDTKFIADNGIVKDIEAESSVYKIKQRGTAATSVGALKPPYHSGR